MVTNDLRRRMEEHLQKKSEYTKHRGPISLIYYEAYTSKEDARKREQVLKQFKEEALGTQRNGSKEVLKCIRYRKWGEESPNSI